MQSQSGITGSSGAAMHRIELGWQVYDALERPIGNVADVDDARGQLRVDGRPVGFEYFDVPLSAVKEVRDQDVLLSVQLDPASAGGNAPRFVDAAATSGATVADVPPAATTPRTTPGRWSSTIERPNIVRVGESQSHNVPVWTEHKESSTSSYAPWIGAVGLGAASAAGYYWWRQRQRRSAFERALDYAMEAFGYAGDTLEPVYDRAKERPGWAAALAAAAAVPLIAYLRGSQDDVALEEVTLERTRTRPRDYPAGDWRRTAARWERVPADRNMVTPWWERAPEARERVASWRESAPSFRSPGSSWTDSLPMPGFRRQTWRDYLTREEESDWVTWPLSAALIGMVAGALWYLFKSDSGESRSARRVGSIMTRHPEVIRPDATVFEAASLMRRLDVGAVPVCDGTRLRGMLTDRDIAVRSTADGRDPHLTLVGDIMTDDVTWAYEDESVERAADLMRRHQIRRLPIISRDKHLVGIVSLGDLAVDTGNDRLSGSTLEEVSEPARPHR